MTQYFFFTFSHLCSPCMPLHGKLPTRTLSVTFIRSLFDSLPLLDSQPVVTSHSILFVPLHGTSPSILIFFLTAIFPPHCSPVIHPLGPFRSLLLSFLTLDFNDFLSSRLHPYKRSCQPGQNFSLRSTLPVSNFFCNPNSVSFTTPPFRRDASPGPLFIPGIFNLLMPLRWSTPCPFSPSSAHFHWALSRVPSSFRTNQATPPLVPFFPRPTYWFSWSYVHRRKCVLFFSVVVLFFPLSPLLHPLDGPSLPRAKEGNPSCAFPPPLLRYGASYKRGITLIRLDRKEAFLILSTLRGRTFLLPNFAGTLTPRGYALLFPIGRLSRGSPDTVDSHTFLSFQNQCRPRPVDDGLFPF